jgi:uncharacterized membrane protein YebE (DUF533 family)
MRTITISSHACAQTLEMLVAMAWADGRLEDSERAGVLAAAGMLKVSKELRARLEDMLRKPGPIDQILFDSLSVTERAFVYVAAAWIANVDEEVDPKERELLDRAASLMGFSRAYQTELEKLALDLKPPAEGGRRWADEVERLFRGIPPRLEGVSEAEVEVVFK